MKKFILCVLLIFILSPVYANADEIALPDSEADKIYSALSDKAKSAMGSLGIDSPDADWYTSLSYKNIADTVLGFLQSGCKEPFVCGISLLAAAVVTSGIDGISDTEHGGALDYALISAVGLLILFPAFKLIRAAGDTIKALATFMLAFVPIFCGVLLSNGKAATASGFCAVMVAVSQIISQICSFIIMPLVSAQLCLGVSAAASPLIEKSSLADTVKKIAGWVLSLILTVFLAVLGGQTVITSATDTAASRTARFVVGTTVPLVGSAISEAANTLRGCMTLVSTGTGIYGMTALIFTVLPVILQLSLWRVSVNLCDTVCSLFGRTRVCGILKAVDSSLSFMVGIIICMAMLFIVSLALVTAAGGRV